MKENSNEDQLGPVRPRLPGSGADGGSGSAPDDARRSTAGGRRPAGTASAGRPSSGTLDLWTVVDLVLQRWHWALLGLVLGGAAFYLLGWFVIHPKFTATAKLLRTEPLGRSDYLKPQPVSSDTFAAILRSPEILKQVGEKLVPPVPTTTLNKWIKISQESESDVVNIQAASRDPQYAVNLVNLYASNAVEYLRDHDAAQARMLAEKYLQKQVSEMDRNITNVEDQFRSMPLGSLGTNQAALVGGKLTEMHSFAQTLQQLQAAMQDRDKLLVDYKEAHPLVQAKEQYIAELQRKLAQERTNGVSARMPLVAAAGTGTGKGANPDVDIITIKLRALEDARWEVAKRMQEAELYAENKPESVQLFAPAEFKTLKGNLHRVKIGLATIVGGGMGLCAGLLLALLVEFLDSRLKTPEDIERVTKLPVLATLGNLRKMPPEERTQWAFRAWTMLQGRLAPSANQGLICGVTSAVPGEGRSTWISLLAEAASLTGYRVLTIATRPSPTHVEAAEDFASSLGTEVHQPETSFDPNGNGHSNALTPNVLTSPARITEELARPNAQPVVHIPLPGWVWNLERREQWREALREWNQTENLVILVELPPATVPESVLLGSNLPNVVWLAGSGTAEAGATRTHLDTLRNARCNLVGAFLNRAPAPSLKYRFPRWLGLAALATLLVCHNASAQQEPPKVNRPPSFSEVPGLTNSVKAAAAETPAATQLAAPPAGDSAVPAPGSPSPVGRSAAPPVETSANTTEVSQPESEPLTNGTFSIVDPSQRAAWQKHLTLGPGDVLTLNLYGQPQFTRTDVAIGPDGRISYLEAQDVPAAGLTVDELRSKLDDALGKFRRAPRTMITPIAFRSKKYYMLGKVATKGVYILDRPLTVLEALARAHGFETALVDRNIYDLVDLDHSFLARQGRRIPLNFQQLFAQGDLRQNVAVEPGDYIYFAPGDVSEVYVVGEVRLPGPVTFRQNLTIIGAIAARAGFTDRAYKAKVLVLRGPLQNPQRIAVNTHAILDANGPDFRLKPKDIIFVSSRPFIRVEELADLAATAFIQSVVTSWVGVDVVKPINQ